MIHFAGNSAELDAENTAGIGRLSLLRTPGVSVFLCNSRASQKVGNNI